MLVSYNPPIQFLVKDNTWKVGGGYLPDGLEAEVEIAE